VKNTSRHRKVTPGRPGAAARVPGATLARAARPGAGGRRWRESRRSAEVRPRPPARPACRRRPAARAGRPCRRLSRPSCGAFGRRGTSSWVNDPSRRNAGRSSLATKRSWKTTPRRHDPVFVERSQQSHRRCTGANPAASAAPSTAPGQHSTPCAARPGRDHRIPPGRSSGTHAEKMSPTRQEFRLTDVCEVARVA